MFKPIDEEYATDDELAWFNLDHYKALKIASAACPPNYGLWVSVIRDRVELERLITAGLKDFVAPNFEKIKAAPLQPLGFDQSYSGAEHATNTPTVKLITSNRVKWLHEAMLRTEAKERTIVDEQLHNDSESVFGDYAHVMINTRATDAQILSNVKSWLSAWRTHTASVTGGDYDSKIKKWASALVVPYMDLELFSLLTGKSIHNAQKFNLLLPNATKPEQEAQRRRLWDLKAQVFTDEMALIIKHLYENQIGTLQE